MRCLNLLLTCILSSLLLAALVAGVHTTKAAPIGGERVPGTETVLYDGSLGTLPAAQGMTYQAADTSGPSYGVEVVQSYAGDGARLDSTADYEDAAGYSSVTTSLNRQQGVTIRFTLQITKEDHTTSGKADKNGNGIADRAGFSVIAIDSDGQRGIELGFWEDQIWAQEGGVANLFTHAEGVSFSTTSLIPYELTMVEDGYMLTVRNDAILSGTLRDYSAFGGFVDPYETPNFVFLGDDTSSASADIKLTSIVVTEGVRDGPYKSLLPLITGRGSDREGAFPCHIP